MEKVSGEELPPVPDEDPFPEEHEPEEAPAPEDQRESTIPQEIGPDDE